MITKIGLNDITSFKKMTILGTDKKINIIYGLNGTGKSTLSNYLYDRNDSSFSGCLLESSNLNNEDILVYNQRFINDYFYETDNLKGIFTLSKENKEAELKIRALLLFKGRTWHIFYCLHSFDTRFEGPKNSLRFTNNGGGSGSIQVSIFRSICSTSL
jgi:AAA15 family ATPase/GTPase